MTKEEKQLLLKELCARLPYNVIINCTEEDDEETNFNCFLAPDMIKDIKSETACWIIKPYLRPMSSMTDEERDELSCYENCIQRVDFYYSHHIDCRFMIEKGLAIEAEEGMYKTK